MKSYTYILLDWDGNLAKTLDMWLDATILPLTNRNISITDSQAVMQCFGRVTEGYAELGVQDIDVAIAEMNTYFKQAMPEAELYPDALFVLEALKNNGKKIALVTTSLRSYVLHHLDKYQIHHLFDVIIAHEDTAKHKPNAEPLEKALEQLGGTKDQALMIGDSDKDIEAGRNAGVDSILFFPPEHKKFYDYDEMQLFKPTYTVDDFRKVLEIAG